MLIRSDTPPLHPQSCPWTNLGQGSPVAGNPMTALGQMQREPCAGVNRLLEGSMRSGRDRKSGFNFCPQPHGKSRRTTYKPIIADCRMFRILQPYLWAAAPKFHCARGPCMICFVSLPSGPLAYRSLHPAYHRSRGFCLVTLCVGSRDLLGFRLSPNIEEGAVPSTGGEEAQLPAASAGLGSAAGAVQEGAGALTPWKPSEAKRNQGQAHGDPAKTRGRPGGNQGQLHQNQWKPRETQGKRIGRMNPVELGPVS